MGEIKNFVKVWISVFASLCYCYFIGKMAPKGKIRVLTILPIIFLFFLLPLNLSSIHLCGLTSFFVAWLANSKLLLFSLGQGPLSSDPSISLIRFITVACLPIKIQHHPIPSPKSPQNITNKETPSPQNQDKPNPPPQIPKKGSKSPLNYAIKSLIVLLVIRTYDYRQYIHPNLILFLYCLHVYLFLDITLAMVAALARTLLGLELEPQFDEPYLSTSLQDFWGRRWNIMASSLLRPTVYDPLRSLSTRIVGRKWAPLPAILGTFIASGLIHELIFYYLGRSEPTWEITWFFVLHGVCSVMEVTVKKALKGKWGLPRVVSGPLTVAFVVVTAFWLFFPVFLRCKGDVRALDEYAALIQFAKVMGRTQTFNVTSA
ncbi:hypothetical protein HHK36_002188 [Tetracentron sinense]|uniref:Wax synthase domain-containing protein n=1 Tax=Tetracentron sinense TaxID=13715 RepID=A0A834ZV02_TETSI|nr:hypothetical protein HHK36_002188 [Tetracentron sinense]